jgi:signal transduction histidine kinase
MINCIGKYKEEMEEKRIKANETIQRPFLDEKEKSFLFPLLLELFQRIGSSLEAIRKMTLQARNKFSDRLFGEHFDRVMAEETERIDIVLRNLLDYIKVNFTLQKSGTIHKLLEEAIQKNRPKLEKKNIYLLKRFEKDLPETIVPDEHLRYMFNSILQHGLLFMPERGNISFVTRSFSSPKEPPKNQTPFRWEGRYIEISFLFDGYRKAEKEGMEFELKLVEEMAHRHQGMMKFESDPQKGKTWISLILPVERRKIIYYQSVG